MTLERFISIVEESDHKVGIYPELKSALAGNLVISSRSQNTTVEQLLINILHRWDANKVIKPLSDSCMNTEQSFVILIQGVIGKRTFKHIILSLIAIPKISLTGIHRHGYNGLDEKKRCLIQSFEIASLVRLHHLTKLPLGEFLIPQVYSPQCNGYQACAPSLRNINTFGREMSHRRF